MDMSICSNSLHIASAAILRSSASLWACNARRVRAQCKAGERLLLTIVRAGRPVRAEW